MSETRQVWYLKLRDMYICPSDSQSRCDTPHKLSNKKWNFNHTMEWEKWVNDKCVYHKQAKHVTDKQREDITSALWYCMTMLLWYIFRHP